MQDQSFDRKTLFLLSNGDIAAVSNQRLYEFAWSQGIKPLRENELKPDLLVRRKRRGPRLESS